MSFSPFFVDSEYNGTSECAWQQIKETKPNKQQPRLSKTSLPGNIRSSRGSQPFRAATTNGTRFKPR
ncbi:hypothetical protein BDU57DRAFT_112144 [Ampelomyces quisqualis]|uniref:Uncharacterized protein n=1 Tax=Ampelomyces quisqualis TaxID=50730 RepID=A0A6A5Q6M5_AMPQU|nr:hypothetical protein BDU57DRAFT_112144 [Ampelomyces quisqualis]